jgi:hypothetical protein
VNHEEARRKFLEAHPEVQSEIHKLTTPRSNGGEAVAQPTQEPQAPAIGEDERPEMREAPPAEEPTYARYNWPEPLAPEAFHGLAGEVVQLIEPHSEGDPAALLVQFLVGFGNIVGRHRYFATEATLHYPNLYCVIVGQTAKGRKGTAWDQDRRVLAEVDPQWSQERVMSGLSSGEGLIWAVRDPIREQNPVKEGRRIVGYEEIESDPGVSDKRLLDIETEFARVLQVMEREANTLESVLRDLYDTGSNRNLTRKQAARCTNAHVSMVAHVTKDEVKQRLSDTSKANGFANRFLWVCARRSKLLPEGGALDTVDFSDIYKHLRGVVESTQSGQQMQRTPAAQAVWREVYQDLSEGKPGMFGAITSRGEAQVLRLSMVYAILDNSLHIDANHLQAALAVWRYAEDSARFIFGDSLGDPTADDILRQLRNRPAGMTRTEIRDYFGRNKPSAEVARALGILQEYGLARMTRKRDESQIRSTEFWEAITTRH